MIGGYERYSAPYEGFDDVDLDYVRRNHITFDHLKNAGDIEAVMDSLHKMLHTGNIDAAKKELELLYETVGIQQPNQQSEYFDLAVDLARISAGGV